MTGYRTCWFTAFYQNIVNIVQFNMFKLIVVISSIFSLGFAAPQNLHPHLKIIGGQPVDIAEIPYQLQLELDYGLICGASLIAPNWALTSAHCTDGFKTENLKIRAGSSQREANGQVVSIKKVYQHPQFETYYFDYDIAILELTKNVTVNKTARPISLIEANATVSADTNATISGWGEIEENNIWFPSRLQIAFVPIIDHNVCLNAYSLVVSNIHVTERMVCAGIMKKNSVDACLGDDGGPLVVNGKLAGIVSGSVGCAEGYPRVYTDIRQFRSFIKEITGL